MLKVYFTAATSYDGDFKNNNLKIVSFIKKEGSLLLSGEQIIDQKLLQSDKKLSQRKIFEREKKFIEESDCVIAEVSKPSLGVGAEISHALLKGKPILALVQEDVANKISPIIAGNPSENLFLEYYREEKIPFLIKDFLKYVMTKKERKGRLIVIDGADGSGKTTQAQLLVAYLKQYYPTKYLDFPQYYNSFHGKTVAKFLRGEFGKIKEVSPYLASLAYALDRASAKQEMDEFLNKGGYIVANRYATSNLAHQSAKFSDQEERERYLKWVYELEYKVHKIPMEDIVIYLYVPWEIGLYLTKNKPVRHYLEGENADIHEEDLLYRQAVEKVYLELAERYKHWVKIECVSRNKISPRQEIHKKILAVLKQKHFI